jgi:hypothetical protein
VAGLLASLLLLALLTKGSFDPTRQVTPEPQALFYDAQARAILRGHLDVPPEAIGGEGIVRDGRTYGYFGIAPALLRLPVVAFLPQEHPNLAPWSYVVAFGVVIAAMLGIWGAVCSELRSRPSPWAAGALTFAVLAASPFVFVVSRPAVYEEAAMWGVAWSLVAYAALLRLNVDERWRWSILAGTAAVMAMLSRPTTGAGAALAVAAGGGLLLLRRRGSIAIASQLVGSAVVAFGSFVLVNHLRFNTLVNPPYQHHRTFMGDPARYQALVRNGGTNGLRYLPTDLVQYLRPDTIHFVGEFPFVDFRMPYRAPILNIGHVYFDGYEFPTSITAVAPALTALAVYGTVMAVRRRSNATVALAGGLISILLASSFFGLSLRYLVDFVPWLAVGGCVGLVSLTARSRHNSVNRTLVTVCLVSLAWSVWVAFSLAWRFQVLRTN